MSFIEKYNILKEKIESGDYSFIGLNHQFFQIILNFIHEPYVLQQILDNTHDPFVKLIIETYLPLSKAHYPITCDVQTMRHLRRGVFNICKYIHSIKDSADDLNKILINIFSYNFLYDASYLDCNVRYLLSSWSYIFRNYAKNSVIVTAPHTRKRDRVVERIRIGFFSDRILNFTSVFRDRGLTIKNLDRSRFEVIVFTSENNTQEYKNEDEQYIKVALDDVISSIDKIVYLKTISRRTVEQIANYELDILVYPDIGMDPPTFYMAHSRLAPVQINTWGHSKTSGISTIDYFFSSKYFESDEADVHYSEKLIRFDSLSTCYPKFEINKFFPREDLKNYPLKEQNAGKYVLFCLQNPRKISLEFMRILYKLHTDYKDRFVILLLDGTKYAGDHLITRFKDQFEDPTFFGETIRIIEECTFIRYNSYMYHSDLVLDTYPFGCCNSSLEAFMKGKVVITRPARYLSGRFTLGFYNRMGINEGPIARDNDEYIEKVLYYAENLEARDSLSRLIKSRHDVLFNEIESVREWEDRCIELLRPYARIGDVKQEAPKIRNMTEDEIRVSAAVKRGDYSFITYTDSFFQFIFNKVVDKKLLDDIIRHIEDPVIRQFFKSVKYLSKAYYPVQHENIVISVMEKEFKHLLKIQQQHPPDRKRIGLALFPYLYELSYFNHNKAPLLKLYAEFIVGLGLTCQRYVKPDCYKPKKRRRIQVGVISFMINQLSSVFRDRSNIVRDLNRDIFEVTICSVPFKYRTEMERNVLTKYNASIEHYKHLNVTDVEELKKLDFDIVVYPDIGMTGNSIIVAYNRLAPVQINTWGHSVTSGIPTIDYYMSSKYFELDDLEEASKHYSEKLIAMDSLCTCYPKFEYESYDTRASLGLPPISSGKKIVFCLQNPRKINKEFMNTLYKIYQAEPDILILLLKGIQNEDDLISNYLNNKSLEEDFVKSIKLVNYTSLATYNSYMHHSDLVLDPYPFGGCNSTLEAFSKGKIVITRPAEYLSGRFTVGFYKRIGVESGGPIVTNEIDYIRQTLFYLRNDREREQLGKFIQRRSPVLYNDRASVKEWEDTLQRLVKPYVELIK